MEGKVKKSGFERIYTIPNIQKLLTHLPGLVAGPLWTIEVDEWVKLKMILNLVLDIQRKRLTRNDEAGGLVECAE